MRIGVVRESMVYPPGSKTEEPIVTAAAAGDQGGARRPAGRDARRIVRSAVDARSRHRGHDDGFPAGAGEAGAAHHARSVVQARARRAAAVQGIRGGDRADRVRARQDLRHGHHAADRLLRRAGGGADRAAREPRHRDHPGAGAGDGVPLPPPAVPEPPGRGLEGAGIHGDARRLPPRSTRDRSSGATISAPRSGTGKR